jgi:DNA transformation protein and related proteins
MTAQSIIRKLETGLTPLGAFRARPMFGGHGLYLDDLMFGLIYDARLYLKADDESRPAFEREGSEPFVYDSGKGCVSTSYWLCPPAAMKDTTKLRAWVGRAHAAAKRVKAKKTPRKPRPRLKRAKI